MTIYIYISKSYMYVKICFQYIGQLQLNLYIYLLLSVEHFQVNLKET